MKLLFAIAIYLVPFLALGQSTASSDTVDYELDRYHSLYPNELSRPDFDSLSLELRIWMSGHYFPNLFIKISRSHQGEWAYSRGYIDYENKRVRTVPNHRQDLNLDSLWGVLQSNNILTLPDQKQGSIIIARNGTELILDQETKEKLIDDRRGEFYIIEVYQPQNYRQFGYYAPESIHTMCVRNNFRCEEHMLMNNIALVILQNFQIKDMVIAQFKERNKK
jgi:hypothetical protein